LADTAPVLYCGICGAANPKENNFCTKCGTSLVLAATTPIVVSPHLNPEISTLPEPVQKSAALEKKRGGCLTAVMIGLMVLGMLELLLFFVRPVPNGLGLGLSGLLILVNGLAFSASGIGLWRWQKWGFSALVVGGIVQSIGPILIAASWPIALSGLLWGVVLIYIPYRLLQPVWQHLE
jgi:hypothetical protein